MIAARLFATTAAHLAALKHTSRFRKAAPVRLAAACLLMMLASLPAHAAETKNGATKASSGKPIQNLLPPSSVTLTVNYNPANVVPGQSWTVNWSSSHALSVQYSCTASGTGYAASGTVALSGSMGGTASAAWVGYPSTCVWTAQGVEDSATVIKTLTTNAAPLPLPTIAVTRTPSTMTAGQGYTVAWTTTNATSLTHSCTAGGTGYAVNEWLAVNGSTSGTASSAWVGYPSTCTWTASGAGGAASTSETMTTVAVPTVSVSRSPATMTAGQGYTLTWNTTNATSLTHSCSAAGSGYAVNESLAVNGSTSGTASSSWVGYPSTCTWTANGAGGAASTSETMNTVAVPTISVSRSPTTMTAGQGYTLTWSTTNATSLTHTCSAAGSGYAVNESLAVNGSTAGTASSAWVGYPSTCTWTASGAGGTASTIETMTTVAVPTVSVSRSPATMTAGQGYTLTWSTTNATSLTHNCSAGGSGYAVSESLAVNGSASGTASSAWVGYPSSCTWTATGAGGTGSAAETMTTVAAPLAPTLSVSRTPSPMIAGQGYTLSWSTANATSLTRSCTAGGSGYSVSDAPAVNGGSVPGTASTGWVGYPSTCTWIASGAGGSKVVTETMTTNLPPPTINVARTPSPMAAGQPFTLSWSSSNASSVTRVCSAGGTGYSVSDAPATSGTASGTASSAWVGYPSTCTWTANGQGGAASYTETMTTNAAPPGDVITYIHTDGLGSPVARSDAGGSEINRTRYEPYGAIASGVTPTIGFTGHVNDADTGLVYMQQRYYDPVAGRFLSVDPVTTNASNGSSFNRYAYANNSPYRYIDPDGRMAIPPALIIPTIAVAGRTALITGMVIAIVKGKEIRKSAGAAISKASTAVSNAIKNVTSNENGSAGTGSAASTDGKKDIKIDDKIQGQLGERGWTEGEVRDLANTAPTGTSTDNRTPNKTGDGKGRSDPASVYGPKDGGHIVVNDVTGEVTQISDKGPGWIPDSRINWK